MCSKQAVPLGHTSRGGSGSLNLKSATAGVDPRLEGLFGIVGGEGDCVEKRVLRDRQP